MGTSVSSKLELYYYLTFPDNILQLSKRTLLNNSLYTFPKKKKNRLGNFVNYCANPIILKSNLTKSNLT